MIRKPVIALAVFLSLLANESFAGARETGVASGAEPAVATCLRGYARTCLVPTGTALAGDFSRCYVTDPERLVHGRGPRGGPAGIAVDASEGLFVGDGDPGRARDYSRNWEPLYDLGIGAAEFGDPATITVEPRERAGDSLLPHWQLEAGTGLRGCDLSCCPPSGDEPGHIYRGRA